MNTLKMKVISFDVETATIVVCFSSDQTLSPNPEDYPPVAYQPLTMWPDVEDVDEIKKRIAVAGMWQVEQQILKERLTNDTDKTSQFLSLVGGYTEYPITDLILPPNPESIMEI